MSFGLLKQYVVQTGKATGKCNDISSADGNITIEPLLKKYKKTIHVFLVKILRSCECYERSKRLLSCMAEERCLLVCFHGGNNDECLLGYYTEYLLNCEQLFSLLMFRS
jgi:hypothetical protein